MTKSLTERVVDTARKRYGVTVYDHDQWGSKQKSLYAKRLAKTAAGGYGAFARKADTLVFHITVTRDDGPTKAAFFADMREVESIGTKLYGSGVSYNFCVDMATGEVGLGQPLDSKGTHTVNHKARPGFSKDQNLKARAIAGIGMPEDSLSPKAVRAYAGLVAAMMDEGALTKKPDAVPHSFFAAKDCPCNPIRDDIPAIMKIARDLRDGSHPAPDEDRNKQLRRALRTAEKEARKVGRDPLADRLRKRRVSLRPKAA